MMHGNKNRFITIITSRTAIQIVRIKTRER